MNQQQIETIGQRIINAVHERCTVERCAIDCQIYEKPHEWRLYFVMTLETRRRIKRVEGINYWTEKRDAVRFWQNWMIAKDATLSDEVLEGITQRLLDAIKSHDVWY